jgi:hypothetical protein
MEARGQGFLQWTTSLVFAKARRKLDDVEDDVVQRMCWSQAAGKELRAKHRKMFVYRQQLALSMEVVKRRCLVAPGYQAHGGVLD